MRPVVLLVVLGQLAAGCADGESNGRRDGGMLPLPDVRLADTGAPVIDAPGGLDAPGLDARAPDTGALTDARPTDAGGSDAGRIDAGRADAGVDAGGGTGLDPALDTPPASNPPCTTPGSSCSVGGDPGVCRFFSATEGRCESCTDCGNLNAPCSDGTECDILFVCYLGRCTNICMLGTFWCGPVEDCIDIGHPTWGACRP